MLAAAASLTDLGDVADVVGGVTKDSGRSRSDSAVVVPYLRVANVKRGQLDLVDLTEIAVEPAKLDKLRLVEGDVLLNEGGDRDQLGRGWVWTDIGRDVIHQNHVFRARLHDDRCSPLALAWMANYGNPRWFERNGKQSTNLASINLTSIKKFPVPLLEQKTRSHFEEVMRCLIETSGAIDEHRQSTQSLRAALLARVLGGTDR